MKALCRMYILLGRELGREHEAGDGVILVGFQMDTDGRGMPELTPGEAE